jgi:hypothetical protein
MKTKVTLTVLGLLASILAGKLVLSPVFSWQKLFSEKLPTHLKSLTLLRSEGDWAQIDEAIRQKTRVYDYLLRQHHLLDGMVVDRYSDGSPANVCDSLLFSSLRYVALEKLGHHGEALKAWRAIERSQDNAGGWFRHPACAKQSTSRDMLVGLLVALSQKPPGYKAYLKDLLSYIKRHSGYISHGPFHVSLLTPGLAEIIRLMAIMEGYKEESLPPIIRYGFSTLAIDTFVEKRGYTSHLNGLVLWLELELIEPKSKWPGFRRQTVRTVFSLVSHLGSYFQSPEITPEQRRHWIAYRLITADPHNLFFQWLAYKTSPNLSLGSTQYDLRRQLMSMSQFPNWRLPSSCERKADYLWQRNSKEYFMKSKNCDKQFAGVDFLWMASLLQDDKEQTAH